jgi:hypothetical protein
MAAETEPKLFLWVGPAAAGTARDDFFAIYTNMRVTHFCVEW